MPLPKSKKTSGLGKAIIRDRFKGNSRPRDGDTTLHTTDLDDGASWGKLRSITQERNLDEFLNTAQLAGTSFIAEKLNIKVVTNGYKNPFLLDVDQEREILARHEANKEKLTIPRRPKWDRTTTSEELERNEKDAFLQWRRDLAYLQEQENFVLTPFERNLEVWRQLWRVIERSDLVVQIVDARNPLFYRSTDLEKYVIEVNENKKNLLLINKADFLSAKQRKSWADYLESRKIRFVFFSAALAQEKLKKEQDVENAEPCTKEALSSENLATPSKSNLNGNWLEVTDKHVDTTEKEIQELSSENAPNPDNTISGLESDHLSEIKALSHENVANKNITRNVMQASEEDENIRILSAGGLLLLLEEEASLFEGFSTEVDVKKLTIGLVGYPNVGKSSTINALLGEKRVSVSSTPGKTKHFQTIHLSPSLLLCDCPGLVFPNFATTNAEMVCNGVLPIDQLREFTGPVGLVAQRIPRNVLESIYGINIRTRSLEEGGDGVPTAEELLVAYAVARGFTKPSYGQPDESRAARYILKDYVNGKIPFCHPPPGGPPPQDFNAELYELAGLIKAKKVAISNDESFSNSFSLLEGSSPTNSVPLTGDKSRALDKSFFRPSTGTGAKLKSYKILMGTNIAGGSFNRVNMYPIHGKIADDGKPVDIGSTQFGLAKNYIIEGKKHHKKGKKNIKNRSGGGYD
ncbi:hypothetical protein G9A89_005470 [Geosiphon pyriformis]|nr:hypothetical protein G9A89_005470 [Geosiphon pyriformis]